MIVFVMKNSQGTPRTCKAMPHQRPCPTKVALRYKFVIIFLEKYNPHPYHGLKDHIHVTQANTGYNLPAVADDTCVQRCKIHPDIPPHNNLELTTEQH